MITKCEICDKDFATDEALNQHNKSKHTEVIKNKLSPQKKKKIIKWTISIVVLLGIIFLVILFVTNIKTMPPTDMQGHIEEWPKTQILKEDIPLPIFKHILEHASKSSNIPGIIINYNCDDYVCEEGLIEKLEEFTKDSSYVYVAPYKNLDAKIVLTKLGRQKVLEEYDKSLIENFIGIINTETLNKTNNDMNSVPFHKMPNGQNMGIANEK